MILPLSNRRKRLRVLLRMLRVLIMMKRLVQGMLPRTDIRIYLTTQS